MEQIPQGNEQGEKPLTSMDKIRAEYEKRNPTSQTESEGGGDIERIVKTWVNDSADWAEAMRDLEKEVDKLNETIRILRSNCQIHTNSIQTLQQHLMEKEAQLQALQSSNGKLVEENKKLKEDITCIYETGSTCQEYMDRQSEKRLKKV